MKAHVRSCKAYAKTPELQAQRNDALTRSEATSSSAKRSRPSDSQPQASSSQSAAFPFPAIPPPSPQLRYPDSPASLSPLQGLRSLTSFSPSQSFSQSPCLAPSPSPSLHDPESPHLKRRRVSSHSGGAPWSAEQQSDFCDDLLDLFVTCGWSYNALSNPQFKYFFSKYLPSADIPDRRTLSGPVLKRQADKVITKTRERIQGKLATYTEDGRKSHTKKRSAFSLPDLTPF
ncbi:hypothetical protein R3P38DRAFT_2573495 [Favolaschia claudopus]|uniref:Uncharacterized protein n=1 Tax=Favolaschia claudopus TaxID=2862362 RepID=A0AAV9ZP62_9AGAR